MIKLSDILNEIKVSSPKNSGWHHDVNRMTDPRVQQAWVDYYTNKIDGKKLKEIIFSVCKNMMDEYHFEYYIKEYPDGIASEESDSPSSSNSFLSGFYDFDFEIDDLSEEEQDILRDKMQKVYYSILDRIKKTDILEIKVNENQQIQNINYYQQVLDQSNGLSITQRQYLQKIINSVKKQNNKATPRQYDLLQRIKSGNFTYSTKKEIKVNNPTSGDKARKLYLAFHDAIKYFDLNDSMDWDNFEIQQDEDGIYDEYSLMDFINNFSPEGTLKKGPITKETLLTTAKIYSGEEDYQEEYNNLLKSAQKHGIL